MATTKITVRNDGSIRVEGDFEVVDQDGKAFGLGGRTTIGLCRCGHSAEQALLRRRAQESGLPERYSGLRSTSRGSQALTVARVTKSSGSCNNLSCTLCF